MAESPAPTRKVTAVGLAGAVTTLLIWILTEINATPNPIPADVAAAVTAILATLFGYFVKD